jgi:hypothetical protein
MTFGCENIMDLHIPEKALPEMSREIVSDITNFPSTGSSYQHSPSFTAVEFAKLTSDWTNPK